MRMVDCRSAGCWDAKSATGCVRRAIRPKTCHAYSLWGGKHELPPYHVPMQPNSAIHPSARSWFLMNRPRASELGRNPRAG